MKLQIADIHPYVRHVGIANGLVQKQTVRAYDHRLMVALQSGGTVEINHVSYTIKTADVYLVEPNVPFRVALEKEQKLVVIAFDWTMQFVGQYNMVLSVAEKNYNPMLITQKVDLSDVFPNGNYTHMHTTHANLTLARELALQDDLPSENEASRDLLRSGMMMQLVSELISPKPQGNEKAEKIYRFICENYDKPLTLQDLADEFHFHTTYINRLLTQQYRISFRQLLIRVRLRQAITLLEDPSLSVQEIANRLGFYDYKHFQQSFRRQYGVTPAQYRR